MSGARFTALDPDRTRYDDWGTLRLRFESCTAASAELVGSDGRQLLALQSLTRIEGLELRVDPEDAPVAALNA